MLGKRSERFVCSLHWEGAHRDPSFAGAKLISSIVQTSMWSPILNRTLPAVSAPSGLGNSRYVLPVLPQVSACLPQALQTLGAVGTTSSFQKPRCSFAHNYLHII